MDPKMTDSLNGFRYVLESATGQEDAGAGAPASPRVKRILLLLHGTGGGEHDLISLGRALDPGATLLSPRGRVLEGNLARFFKRVAEGVFDQISLAHETDALATFVSQATLKHGLQGVPVTALGFSNGANIASSLLLRYPEALAGAVLLSPMVPFEPQILPELVGKRVFVGAGRNDPLVESAEVERLEGILGASGATVTLHWHSAGHGVDAGTVDALRDWLKADS